MEIEYESPPRFPQNAAAGPSYSDDEDEVEQQEEVEEPVEQEDAEGEGEEEDEGEGVEAQAAAPKAKAKRIIKSRQSLAEKQPGTTLFPIARIKKIIKADKDVDTMSAEATFLIAVATEYFIQHFMEEGYTKARLDKRKIVNYRDLASIAQRSDEFSFLQGMFRPPIPSPHSPPSARKDEYKVSESLGGLRTAGPKNLLTDHPTFPSPKSDIEPELTGKDVIPMPMSISEALEKRKQKQLRDENPTIHDDDTLSPSDVLPPLTSSKNPLFPNAVIKRPANSHAKGASKKGHVSEGSDDDDIQEVVNGSKSASTAKNGGTPVHSHGTRKSRRSMAAGEADEELQETIVNDDDAMDED